MEPEDATSMYTHRILVKLPSKCGLRNRFEDFKARKKELLEREGYRSKKEADRMARLEFADDLREVGAIPEAPDTRVHQPTDIAEFNMMRDVLWVYHNGLALKPSVPPSSGAAWLLEIAKADPQQFFKDFMAPIAKSEVVSGLNRGILEDDGSGINWLNKLDELS